MYVFTTLELQIKNHNDTLLHTHFGQLKSQRLSRQRGKTNVELPTVTLMYNWRVICQSLIEKNTQILCLCDPMTTDYMVIQDTKR